MSVSTNIQTINFNKPVQQNAQKTFRSQTVPARDYPPDAVEINGKKKSGMSNGAKLGIGLGILTVGTFIAAIALNKINKVTPTKLQQVFNDVYMREDITVEQAKNIANKFKEIEKIENREDFIKAAFEETKKNFGFADKPIKLTFAQAKGSEYGWCLKDNSAINITENCPRRSIISCLHHEFRHAKQNELMFNEFPEYARERLAYALYNHGVGKVDMEVMKYVDSLIDKNILDDNEIQKRILQKFGYKINDLIKTNFGDLSPNNVPNKYKDFAKKCLENNKNLIKNTEDKERYRKQFIEADAFSIEEKIFNTLLYYKP